MRKLCVIHVQNATAAVDIQTGLCVSVVGSKTVRVQNAVRSAGGSFPSLLSLFCIAGNEISVDYFPHG